ncbi:MAG: PKD domain-containing protein, partial [Bacteroidales bacterium]|nr:PKD domain-containing protein [Bacteroidales bacterium]
PHVPEADFTADITEACEQLEVQFTDQSLHNPTSWYWDFGDGESSIEQNPIHLYSAQGTYTVSLTATNSQGSDEYVFTGLIQVHSNPTIELGEDIEQCGSSVTLDAGAGFDTYTWNGTTGNQTHTVSTTDTYTVIVEDANGCTATDAVDVTIYDIPTVDLGDDVEQCGSSVTLDAASGFDTYTWNGTTGNQTHTVSTSDTYTVVVEDANGCTGTDGVDVTIHDLPTVDLGDDFNICNGTSETLDADSGFVSYEWNGTVGTQTLLIDAADTYTVIVEDANGCTATDNVIVGVNPSPTLILEMTEESSAGAGDGTATAIAENGTPAYQYAWDFGGFVTNVVTGLNAGTYCVTVVDDNGCTVSDCIIVTIADQPTPPIADFTADITEYCGQLTVQFTDQSTNNPTSWTWDFGDGSGSNLENPTHTYSLPGTYTVSLTVSNDDGTSDPQIKTDYIIIHEVPLIDAGDDFDVCGPYTQLDCTSAGFPGSWQPINGIIFDPDSQDPHAEVCSSIYGSRSFIWIENNGPCSARDTVIVTFWEEPISFITTQDTSVCGNCFEELEVSSENSIDGFWFIPTDPTAQFWTEDSEDPDTVCVTTFGVHTLYYISMNGPEYAEPDFCNDTAWVNITFNANPVLEFETTDESMAGAADGEITLNITEGLPPYTINWSNGDDTETINNLNEGIYSVTVTDDNECMAVGSDTVFVYNAITGEKLGFVQVYPNPAKDVLFISSDVEIEYITLYDAIGRKVLEQKTEGKLVDIDVSTLISGNYVIKIRCKLAMDLQLKFLKL